MDKDFLLGMLLQTMFKGQSHLQRLKKGQRSVLYLNIVLHQGFPGSLYSPPLQAAWRAGQLFLLLSHLQLFLQQPWDQPEFVDPLGRDQREAGAVQQVGEHISSRHDAKMLSFMLS